MIIFVVVYFDGRECARLPGEILWIVIFNCNVCVLWNCQPLFYPTSFYFPSYSFSPARLLQPFPLSPFSSSLYCLLVGLFRIDSARSLLLRPIFLITFLCIIQPPFLPVQASVVLLAFFSLLSYCPFS